MVDFAAHTARIINRIGQPVTITPSGQPARVVNAVFTSRPTEAYGLVSGFSPTLRVCAGDSADVSIDDSVEINGVEFIISGVDDDSSDSGDRLFRLEAR